MTTLISIEGNIGSGKSTLVETLRLRLPETEFHFLAEPVDSWASIVDEHGVDIISRFYEDQDKYAFPFQMMAYISRLAILKDAVTAHPDKVIITERSVLTDREVFAKMMYHEKKIDEISYRIYLKWFDHFLDDIPETKMVYVRTSPEVCFDRVHSRCRTGEEGLSMEYLRTCGSYHDEWLDSCDVLNIPGDQQKREDFDPVVGWCETVKQWLDTKGI